MQLKKFSVAAYILFVLCSLNVNAQWTKEIGIDAQFVEALYVYDYKLYAGTDTVIFIKDGTTGMWKESAPLPAAPGAGVSSIFRTGNRLFAGTYAYGIFESTDDGNTWVQRNSGIGTSYKITSFTQRDNKLYTGTAGNAVFTMDLNAAIPEWSPFRNGLPFNTGAWDVNSIYNYQGTLISAAGQSGYIYFNESVSEPWYDREFGGSGQSGLAMWDLIHSGSLLVGAASSGLYRSTDDGLNWEYFNPELGYIDIANFTVKGNKIYAALTKSTYGTIIYSTVNGGLNWNFEDNLPGVLSFDFAVLGDHLYLAAFDGLWYRTLNPSSIKDDKRIFDFELCQNYPNPFNPATNLTFVIGNLSFVTLKVYDLLGKEVTTLVNEYKPAGTYKFTFDASQLTSGVYFYQMRSGDFIQTRKMIVVK